MMNPSQVRVIDPILTTVALGYRNAEMVGVYVFPRVPVQISGGQVLQFGKEGFMAYNLKRAPGGATKRMDFGYLGVPYALLQDSIEQKVPFEYLRDASVMPGIDLGTRAVNLGMRIVTLSLEIDQAAAALNPAAYDGNHTVVLAGAEKWSDPSSDPVAQVLDYKENVRSSVGVYPNLATFSPVAWTAFITNPNVVKRFQYTTASAITEDMIARLLQLEKVVVGKAVKADDAGNMSDVWGNNCLLSYSPSAPEGMETPSYGYTYTMEGNPLVEQPYMDRNAKSWIYPVTFERVPVITAAQAGFLIQAPN